MSFPQRISLTRDALELRRRWTVALEPAGPAMRPSQVQSPLEIVATIDARPVFDRTTATRAGWKVKRSAEEEGLGVFSGRLGSSGRMAAVVVGDNLRLQLRKGPQRGRLRVSVNEMERIIDLGSATDSVEAISFSTGQPHGIYTSIPAFSPGQYLETQIQSNQGAPQAIVRYRYTQQDGRPEANTRVRIYHEDPTGRWHLIDELAFLARGDLAARIPEFRRHNPDAVNEYERIASTGDRRTFEQWLGAHLETHPGESLRPGIINMAAAAPTTTPEGGAPRSWQERRVPLPTGLRGRLQLAVIPGTATKAGPEYFGLPFDCADLTRLDPAEPARPITVMPGKIPAGYKFPFGEMLIRLKFPTQRFAQAEPILATGVENAGDFVYVIYSDRSHIRLGFDHWFKGGPVSAPIAIDYDREHELAVSLGSFYPPPDDAVFYGVPAARIAAFKHSLTVRLDGRAVLQGAAEFYDIAPTQITVGRNEIHGTTSGPIFTGQLEGIARRWPDGAGP